MGASILETPRMTAKWQKKLDNQLAAGSAEESYNPEQSSSSSSSTKPKKLVDDEVPPSPTSMSSSSTSTPKMPSRSASENSVDSSARIIPEEDLEYGAYSTRISRIRAVFSFKNPSENVFFWLPFVTLLREGAEVINILVLTSRE
jgi:hypothetical protein